ncbi:MAG: Gfo/Idh/MocA family oxidoreductase [Williamsia sp.]|nr:Gfo/Idh/MocA family oxidoreductase [Williamsia sp.]
MKQINWGIIGCGDVTEVKSGPAFNKVANSSLVAVMRRDAAKAADYAARHGVPAWYNQADQLLNDPDVNAIYIATPPDSHEAYTLEALKSGKPVYVEKPMSLTEASCLRMLEAASKYGTKLTVAHYRRALPLFNKVKELLAAGAIGKVLFVKIDILQPAKNGIAVDMENNWRIDPAISGGGLFHDLAPHHLDIMIWLFGPLKSGHGYSANQSGASQADDIVTGELLFANGVLCQGVWCFHVPAAESKDSCVIMGSQGKIEFSFHKDQCRLVKGNETEEYTLKSPAHIQQPMIEQVVRYFRGEGPNPCPAEDGATVLRIMDTFTLSKPLL